MRMLSRFVLSLAILAIGTLVTASSRAEESPSEVTIVKIISRSGAPTVLLNGTTQTATENMRLPVGAVIQTTGQEVYVEVTTGVVATVKPNSKVAVDMLSATDTQLELRQGQLVTQIDKQRKSPRKYGVKVGNGVAAARGTSFTVSNDATGFSITTTADGVEFNSPAGKLTIQAGQYTFTPAGSNQLGQPVSLASAATDPQVAAIIRDAVSTAATVVQNNLGAISADQATNIVSQVVAVAVGALPQEATAFTQTAVAAVTAPGSAAAPSADAAANAAGAVTAAAVSASPDNAAAIAGAAAAASPGNAGIITAAAQQVAPAAKDAIAGQVAASTGQSTSTVQSNADASASQATNAVNTAKDATSNVVAPSGSTSSGSTGGTQGSAPKTTDQESTPTSPVDPSLNTSPAT